MGEMRYAYKVFESENLKVRDHLETRHKLEDCIKMDLRELGHLFIYYLFTYLFKDVVGSSDFTVSNDRMIMNSQLERTWKKVIMA
jgi:hypothetical protein